MQRRVKVHGPMLEEISTRLVAKGAEKEKGRKEASSATIAMVQAIRKGYARVPREPRRRTDQRAATARAKDTVRSNVQAQEEEHMSRQKQETRAKAKAKREEKVMEESRRAVIFRVRAQEWLHLRTGPSGTNGAKDNSKVNGKIQAEDMDRRSQRRQEHR